jgi:hypothetical protein
VTISQINPEEVFGPDAPAELARRLLIEIEGAKTLLSAVASPGCSGCERIKGLYGKLAMYLVAIAQGSIHLEKENAHRQELMVKTLRNCFPEQARRHTQIATANDRLEAMSVDLLYQLAVEWATEQRDKALAAGRKLGETHNAALNARIQVSTFCAKVVGQTL